LHDWRQENDLRFRRVIIRLVAVWSGRSHARGGGSGKASLAMLVKKSAMLQEQNLLSAEILGNRDRA